MKVIDQRIEKLIILNLFETILEKFKESYIYVGSTVHPKWVNGYLLYFSALEDTDYHQKMQAEKKTMIWDYLEYVKLEKFEEIIKNSDANASIRVHDLSASPFFADLVKFLRGR